jgi:5'-deoxynucleotidase YfbR-like HD superfamily hydrolase
MLLGDLEARRGVRINVEKVLRMAALHDLAESLTFDISRAYLEYLGMRGESMKREIERSAWEHIAEGVREPELARRYASAHNEYVANETQEAQIVHAADSLDILLQVVSYLRIGYPAVLLSDLWKERVKMIKKTAVPSARNILKSIISERAKLTARRKFR